MEVHFVKARMVWEQRGSSKIAGPMSFATLNSLQFFVSEGG